MRRVNASRILYETAKKILLMLAAAKCFIDTRRFIARASGAEGRIADGKKKRKSVRLHLFSRPRRNVNFMHAAPAQMHRTVHVEKLKYDTKPSLLRW